MQLEIFILQFQPYFITFMKKNLNGRKRSLEAQVFNSSQPWGSFKQQSISGPAVFHHNSITSTQKPLLSAVDLYYYITSLQTDLARCERKKMPLTYTQSHEISLMLITVTDLHAVFQAISIGFLFTLIVGLILRLYTLRRVS